MLERPIPASGERIPAVGLGTWQTFDVGASAAERAPLKDVLRQFVSGGGRVIDSSPMYGLAETVVGDLAADLGLSSLFLATKVWTSGRDAGIRQMETSLKRLRVSRIDLMQIHNLVDWRTHLKTLRQWKDAGKVRYIGITHYHSGAFADLERIIRAERPDFVQFNYNIVDRAAENRLLPLAAATNIAVLINRPFEEGALFARTKGVALPPFAKAFDCASWGQFFLKFILGEPAVTCAIPATREPQHLVDNLAAGRGRLPDARERAQMADFVARL